MPDCHAVTGGVAMKPRGQFVAAEATGLIKLPIVPGHQQRLMETRNSTRLQAGQANPCPYWLLRIAEEFDPASSNPANGFEPVPTGS